MQKFLSGPMVSLFFALNCAVSGVLYHFRLLPSLQPDTNRPSGTPSIEQFAPLLSNVSFFFAAVFLVGAGVWVATIDEPRRCLLASLPRWQQWLIWPFHSGITSGTVGSQPPTPNKQP